MKLEKNWKRQSQNNNKLMLNDSDLVYISHMKVQFNVFDYKKKPFLCILKNRIKMCNRLID